MAERRVDGYAAAMTPGGSKTIPYARRFGRVPVGFIAILAALSLVVLVALAIVVRGGPEPTLVGLARARRWRRSKGWLGGCWGRGRSPRPNWARIPVAWWRPHSLRRSAGRWWPSHSRAE